MPPQAPQPPDRGQFMDLWDRLPARLRIIAVFWLSPIWLFPIVTLIYLGWRLAVRRMLVKE